MSEKVIDDIKSVKDEQESMIETLRAIKGEAYSSSVEMAIAGASLIEIVAMLRDVAEKSNGPVADALGKAACSQLAKILALHHEQSPIDDELVPDIMADADRIIETTKRLLSHALDAARHNKPFGDSK